MTELFAFVAGFLVCLTGLSIYWSVKGKALPTALTLPPSLYELAPAPGLGEHGFHCTRLQASLTEVQVDSLYMTIAHRHTPEYARRCAAQFLRDRGVASPIVTPIIF